MHLSATPTSGHWEAYMFKVLLKILYSINNLCFTIIMLIFGATTVQQQQTTACCMLGLG